MEGLHTSTGTEKPPTMSEDNQQDNTNEEETSEDKQPKNRFLHYPFGGWRNPSADIRCFDKCLEALTSMDETQMSNKELKSGMNFMAKEVRGMERLSDEFQKNLAGVYKSHMRGRMVKYGVRLYKKTKIGKNGKNACPDPCLCCTHKKQRLSDSDVWKDLESRIDRLCAIRRRFHIEHGKRHMPTFTLEEDDNDSDSDDDSKIGYEWEPYWHR